MNAKVTDEGEEMKNRPMRSVKNCLPWTKSLIHKMLIRIRS